MLYSHFINKSILYFYYTKYESSVFYMRPGEPGFKIVFRF